MGPATKPCSARMAISVDILGARPHSQDAMTNSSTLAVNKRTWPKRCDSQPVSGSAIALATPKLVTTQVPWLGLTPKSPAMAGRDTLAIDESSTFIKVAADSAIVPHRRSAPCRGWFCANEGAAAAAAATGAGALSAAGLAALMGRFRCGPGRRWRRWCG